MLERVTGSVTFEDVPTPGCEDEFTEHTGRWITEDVDNQQVLYAGSTKLFHDTPVRVLPTGTTFEDALRGAKELSGTYRNWPMVAVVTDQQNQFGIVPLTDGKRPQTFKNDAYVDGADVSVEYERSGAAALAIVSHRDEWVDLRA